MAHYYTVADQSYYTIAFLNVSLWVARF